MKPDVPFVPATVKDSRLLACRKLINRSARLLKLIELDGPEVIIERERQLVERALREFAVNEYERAHAPDFLDDE